MSANRKTETFWVVIRPRKWSSLPHFLTPDGERSTKIHDAERYATREEAERVVAERTPVLGLCLPRFVTLTTDVYPFFWYSVEEEEEP